MPTTFANTINGDEILAKRSQCDYAGNDIQTTYATKSELPTTTSDLTNDSGYITLSDVPAQVNADWDSSSGASEILNKPTIPSGSQLVPAATSADANKVLKVNASGTPEWSIGGGGSQVNSDWDATSGVAEILNKPTPKTLTAGANISISEGASTLTISAAAGLPASTSADEGKCLVVDSNGDPEWGTGGKTYTGVDGVTVDNVNDTVGLEAPVDIVAGPGIAIDNPDGNTVRISVLAASLAAALGIDETVLWEGSSTPPSGDTQLTLSITFNESVANFQYVDVYWIGDHDNRQVTRCYVTNGYFFFGTRWPENSSSGNWFMMSMKGEGTAGTRNGGYKTAGSIGSYGSYGGGMWGAGTIWKVVGVHRIAGGN